MNPYPLAPLNHFTTPCSFIHFSFSSQAQFHCRPSLKCGNVSRSEGLQRETSPAQNTSRLPHCIGWVDGMFVQELCRKKQDMQFKSVLRISSVPAIAPNRFSLRLG
jgi:hypothetical protein